MIGNLNSIKILRIGPNISIVDGCLIISSSLNKAAEEFKLPLKHEVEITLYKDNDMIL